MKSQKIIRWHDIFLILVATSVALISSVLIGLFDGSIFSIMQILVVSFANIFGVFVVTVFICFILKILGFKFK